MKRKTREQLQRELRLGTKRHLRNIERRDTKYDLDKSTPPNHDYLFKKHIVIKAPRDFSIYGKAEASSLNDSLNFISTLGETYGRKSCVIDFSETNFISAAALLAAYAAIDNSYDSGTAKAYILWSNTTNNVNATIRRTHFHRLIQRRKINPDFSTNGPLPIICGSGADLRDDIVDYIQRSVYEDNMSPETEHVYGDAVSETINNVDRHAYPDLETDQKKWWLICDLFGDQLYLAIYDIGVGIPKTVVDRPWFLASMKKYYPAQHAEMQKALPDEAKGLRAFVVNKFKDSQLIYLSMQGEVTGTKVSKHGQGSKSIKKLVSDTIEGTLWVFSNKGVYKFEEEDTTPSLYRLPLQLPGTLIQWNITVR